jgi:hypothetical protein
MLVESDKISVRALKQVYFLAPNWCQTAKGILPMVKNIQCLGLYPEPYSSLNTKLN